MIKKSVVLLSALFLVYLSGCGPATIKKTKPAEKVPQAPVAGFNLKAYVIKEKVNIRQKPNTRSKIVNTLEDGAVVHILQNQNGWYQIVTENGLQGWARSDLIGPRSLSKTAMAAAFNDSVMPNFSAQLFIDKNQPYKVIYLKFNQIDAKRLDTYVKRIVQAYQQKVYRGSVTVHVIKENSDAFIKTYTFKGAAIAEIPLPVLKIGVLHKIELHGNSVKLRILVENAADKKQLVKLARSASAIYDYPFDKAEIIVRSWPARRCLLYYVEDAYGENYYFDRCQPPAS